MSKRISLQCIAVCFIASLLVGYQFMIQIMPGLMVGSISSSLHISLAQTGFVSSAMFYSYLALQAPCGAIVQRTGARGALLVAAAGIPLACLAMSLSSHYYIAMISRFMAGVFAAPCVVSCFILGHNWLPARWFPVLCGFVEMMGMLGAAIGPVIVSDFMKFHGWQYTLKMVALIGVGLFFLVLFLVRNRPPQEADEHHDRLKPSHQSDEIRSGAIRTLLKTPGFVTLCLFGFFVFAILNSFAGLWLVPYASCLYQLPEASMGILLTSIFTGTACGIVLNCLIIHATAPEKLMRAGVAASIVLFSLIIFTHLSFHLLLLCTFFLGLCASVYLIPFSLIKACIPARLTGLALGIANGAIISSGLVFQPLSGWLITFRGTQQLTVSDYRIAFLPLLAALLIALLISLRSSGYCHKESRTMQANCTGQKEMDIK